MLFVLAALTAGCSGDEPSPTATPEATPTAMPAATATAAAPQTHTPSPSSTPLATLTPASNATPTPTPAPPPDATATAASTPTTTATPTPTATQDDLSRFGPPDPEAGAAIASEALIAGQVFQLEVASTPAERARGLMGQQRIPDNYAMLFVFESERRLSFWMKGTLIPLDILFLGSNGMVVDVQTMIPQPGAPDGELIVYRSAGPARYALEMNAGLAEALGVVPGAAVLFD